MSPARTRVLVLYRHPLMGEGLARLLGDDARLEVTSAAADEDEAVERALATDPAVVVFEEGGPLEALEMLRRASCHYVIDVSLSMREAWAIRGGAVRTDPDHLTQAIVDACLAGAIPAVAVEACLAGAIPAVAVIPVVPDAALTVPDA